MYSLLYLPTAEILYTFETKFPIDDYIFFIAKSGSLNWTPAFCQPLPTTIYKKIFLQCHLVLIKVKDV